MDRDWVVKEIGKMYGDKYYIFISEYRNNPAKVLSKFIIGHKVVPIFIKKYFKMIFIAMSKAGA